MMKRFFVEILAYVIEALVILACAIIVKTVINVLSSQPISIDQALLYFVVGRIAIMMVDGNKH